MSESSIRHPPKPTPDNPVIIYLPRGGPITTSGPDLLTVLCLSSNATVVRVNYRLSAQHPYPTPVHDVLAGYDWIKAYLGQGTAPPRQMGWKTQARKIGICGELIGGSLAGMLALTECHVNKLGIGAAVLGNPTSDWTNLFAPDDDSDANASTSLRHDKTDMAAALAVGSHEGPTINSLLSLRDSIFPNAASFFDPFASPSLFFRTPSFDLPPRVNPLLIKDKSSSEDESLSEPSSAEADVPETVVRSRFHLKYPPMHLNLQIPRIRVELGKKNVLQGQGIEFVELMRRSLVIAHRRDHPGGEQTDGKDRIELLEREGLGLWSEKEANDIGRWFAEVLR